MCEMVTAIEMGRWGWGGWWKAASWPSVLCTSRFVAESGWSVKTCALPLRIWGRFSGVGGAGGSCAEQILYEQNCWEGSDHTWMGFTVMTSIGRVSVRAPRTGHLLCSNYLKREDRVIQTQRYTVSISSRALCLSIKIFLTHSSLTVASGFQSGGPKTKVLSHSVPCKLSACQTQCVGHMWSELGVLA